MYTSINPNEILQGDLIGKYSFIVPPTGELQVVEKGIDGNLKSVPLSQIEKPYGNGKASVVANSFISDAIIISQSCDIQRRDYVHVCPVHRLDNLVSDFINKGYENKRVDDIVESLKNDKINYYFYLPSSIVENFSIDESYADLQFVGMVPLANLKMYTRNLALTDLGRHRLSFKLINLYGRPF